MSTQFNIRARFLLALLLPTVALTISAQVAKSERLLSFEESNVPGCIHCIQSSAAISDIHYKDGAHALEWNYKPNAVLSIKKDLKFERRIQGDRDLYLSAFVVWVYNEQAQDKTITFQFLKDGKVCTSFPFNINFKGWRGAWVCYERDMQGTPEEGMNEICIQAPDVKGKLFFDQMITASKVDPRQQTADWQVPFVNAKTTSHWLQIYNHSLLKPDMPLTAVTDKQKEQFKEMEGRFMELIYHSGKFYSKTVAMLRQKFDAYHITYKKGKVSGTPIFFVRQSEAFERIIPGWDKDMYTKMGVEMQAYFDLMYQISTAYLNADDDNAKGELKKMFLDMYNHITDQGVIYGSCWGNIHHYGYSMRNLYTSYFLMRDVLAEAGKLQEAEQTMRWYAITNEVFLKPEGNGIDMDAFNTLTEGRIASILMMEDTPQKVQYLKSFSRWIDYGCRPAPGLSDSFKSDGSAYHHCNNYPAYATGGMGGAVNMIYILSHTDFAVSPLAQETLKKSMLTMRFYCNTLYFPLSMSGRHPNGKGKLIPIQYAYLAVAGSPDGKQAIDKDMAGAYLRLAKAFPEKVNKPNTREAYYAGFLSQKGFTPEPDPQGNIALGYACVSVQRRNNWSAVVRGHSRYLWDAEHYLQANMYGRYLAYGSMQILTAPQGQAVTPFTSGWQQEGFDWNRIPGASYIHLPYDQLRARIINADISAGVEEMLYSDEAFAGGLSQEGSNGNFGMKLHEHDKYNGSMRARKSYHFVDGLIVCLGSDIENKNTENNTETCIFQLALTNDAAHSYWKNYHSDGKVWIDHLGTGYYVPSGANFEMNCPQLSRTQDTEKETKGDWVSLTFNHGKAPQQANYEYAVMPQTTAEAMSSFESRPAYKVIKKDHDAHIVSFPSKGITSYVLFEKPAAPFKEGLILNADTACLAMTHTVSPSKMTLTVAQPDLALYRGKSDDKYDKNGKRVERSIYGRPWIKNESGIIPVTITLKGTWGITDKTKCEIISQDKSQTVLRFKCREGASFDVELTKL